MEPAFVSSLPVGISTFGTLTSLRRPPQIYLASPARTPLCHPRLPRVNRSSLRAFRPRATASAGTAGAGTKSPPRIIISGAPASGKGTQCALVVDAYALVHLSTGDMLRAAVAAGTDLGVTAKGYMDAGALVPDSLVIEMVIERVKRADCVECGWLLDGFPRTEAQAKALDDAGIIADAVVCLDVEDKMLVERVVGRRLDPVTGDIYHTMFNPPPAGEVAERCVQRGDDTEEKAVARLAAFHRNSEAIEKHYADVLSHIDGSRGKMEVFGDVKSIIDDVVTKEDGTGPSGSGGTTGVPTDSVVPSDSTSSASTKGMPVAEFVRRAEEAYEKGYLSSSDTNYSGQAGIDSAASEGVSSYPDLGQRWGLAVGDFAALLTFAFVGRMSHGGVENESVTGVLATAGPFLISWFLISPLLGAYKRATTSNVTAALTTTLVPVAASTGGGLAIRFGWRATYTSIRGPETAEYRRGGLGDGLAMVTTLFRRW